jgi:hypothetical protein
MISSQLASQLVSKNSTWEILRDRLHTRQITCPQELRLEIWHQCVYVHLPKNPIKINPQGVSTMLSFWDYLDAFMSRCIDKARRCHVFLEKDGTHYKQFSVTSAQSVGDSYRVWFSRTSAGCNCMLFRCIANRLGEHKYLRSLIKESQFFSNQSMCHHLQAALDWLGVRSLYEYFQPPPQ